jgi:hypothetical protein
LDLVYRAKLLCPLPILLGRVCPDLPYISDNWEASRAIEAGKPSIIPFNLSEEDVEEDIENHKIGECGEWMFFRESSNGFNLIYKHCDRALSNRENSDGRIDPDEQIIRILKEACQLVNGASFYVLFDLGPPGISPRCGEKAEFVRAPKRNSVYVIPA